MNHEAPHQDGKTILRSQIECDHCLDVIASLDRHDFNSCHCGRVSIDGGRDYLRVAFKDDGRWINRSIWVEGELTNAEAGFTLAVLKAVGFAYIQTLDRVTTTEVLKAYEAMKRPYMPAFFPTNLRKAVLHALKLLHRSGVLRQWRDTDLPLRGYEWWFADGVKMADIGL
jgi:hypothetical protein